MPVFAGLDGSQAKTTVCLVDQRGLVTRRGTWATSPTAITRTLATRAPRSHGAGWIIHAIWPDDEPVRTGRHALLEAARDELAQDGPPGLRYLACDDSAPCAAMARHTMASEVGDSSGTSTLLAAWSAAVYVAQIEDGRMTEALATTRRLDVTRATLRRYGGLWFNDELFVSARRA